jgi:hypothetical protein
MYSTVQYIRSSRCLDTPCSTLYPVNKTGSAQSQFPSLAVKSPVVHGKGKKPPIHQVVAPYWFTTAARQFQSLKKAVTRAPYPSQQAPMQNKCSSKKSNVPARTAALHSLLRAIQYPSPYPIGPQTREDTRPICHQKKT